MSLSIERLCRCYDGDFWYVLKGTKGKRVGVTSDSPPCFYHSSAVPRVSLAKNCGFKKMGWQRECFSFIEEDQKISQKTLTLLTSLLLNPIHSRRWGYWCYVFFTKNRLFPVSVLHWDAKGRRYCLKSGSRTFMVSGETKKNKSSFKMARKCQKFFIFRHILARKG